VKPAPSLPAPPPGSQLPDQPVVAVPAAQDLRRPAAVPQDLRARTKSGLASPAPLNKRALLL
jgi:hypothetical protein